MKLSKIAKLCKSSGRINLFRTDSGDQWIGDTAAIYPVYNLFDLDEESLYTIFDITEKQQEKIHYHSDSFPTNIDPADAVEGENQLDCDHLEICTGGSTNRPLITQAGVVFINTKYLEPLSDVQEELELYERFMPSGEIYIVAKCGLMIKAIIFPNNIINKNLVEKMEKLAKLCRVSLENIEK